MKLTTPLLSLCLSALAFCASAQSTTGFTRSAEEIATEMGIGWNLGNTLEAGNNANNFTNRGGLGAETAWQQTKTTQQVIDYVRELGFRSVRIPCAWVMGHIKNAETYEIDPQWMARVKEVVDYCINADLYVVINQHWDGGWLENNIKDNASLTRNKEILQTCWTQIANAFKDYDEHLLFAGLNEPNAEDQASTNNLLAYEKTFIDAVRETGGNNAYRTLVIQGPSTDIERTISYVRTLPSDPAGDGRLMMEVHYYNPWQFWGMEKDESWGKVFYYWGEGNHKPGSQHNPNWDCEEAAMRRLLDQMKTHYVDKGIPVIIGEFGANWRDIHTLTNESQTLHDASIRSHYYTLISEALKRGMVPMVWDTNYCNRPTMSIINRKSLSIYDTPAYEGMRQAYEEYYSGLDVIESLPITSPLSYDLIGRPLREQEGTGWRIKNGQVTIVK